jgi:hypothetical protein
MPVDKWHASGTCSMQGRRGPAWLVFFGEVLLARGLPQA